MAHERIKSKAGLALVARVRAICARYPEVGERIDAFGLTSFRVRDKPFVFMGERDGVTSMSFRLLHETQDFLTRPSDRFSRAAYIGQHGWTDMKPEYPIDWEEVESFIDEAYRRTAPKTLLKQL
jgi:predicted DNA-binding protein (MmcQ/YjbR family)